MGTFYSNTPVLFGSVSMVTASLGSKDPQLGSRVNVAGNEYVFVYNSGNSEIQTGYAAVANSYTDYSCTVSSTGQIDRVLGVVKHATLTTGTYGWLLTRGFGSLVVSSTVAANDYVAIGANGKVITAVTFPGFAKVASAAVTGASTAAYIAV